MRTFNHLIEIVCPLLDGSVHALKIKVDRSTIKGIEGIEGHTTITMTRRGHDDFDLLSIDVVITSEKEIDICDYYNNDPDIEQVEVAKFTFREMPTETMATMFLRNVQVNNPKLYEADLDFDKHNTVISVTKCMDLEGGAVIGEGDAMEAWDSMF
jgi:hypothetical protein|tara:strand:- start:175 stop:639 length:465 start_codon:yes stop_codon:yes gene_type:complete